MKDRPSAASKNGGHLTQEQLYNQMAPMVMGVCQRYSNGEEEAKDMFQEAFINIFKSVQAAGQINNMEAWVRKVAINTAINYYKAQQKHRGHEDFLGTEMCFESSTGYTQIIQRLSEQELVRLINTLPRGCRIIFNLHAIEGYNHAEIAQMMGISEGTSKSQLARAKNMLKAKLQILDNVVYATTAK